MEKWEYMMQTVLPTLPGNRNYLVRRKSGVVEDWTSQRKTWEQNNDAVGAFIGFEDDFKHISEEEVNKIIEQYN
ncbi:hypothetical protein [Clostridium sporogenes]|uniref:hypothetical protein n=1 Tax=Clostridium sporogenes TaxID=1509 RepID=UPI000667B27C|nr:hypothetical protein [Clostridium sporogenes]